MIMRAMMTLGLVVVSTSLVAAPLAPPAAPMTSGIVVAQAAATTDPAADPMATGADPVAADPMATGADPMAADPMATGADPMATGTDPMATDPMATDPMATGTDPMATGAEAASTAAPADAATQAAQIAQAAAAQTAEVQNPYGLENLWEQGDIVAHTTLIILVIMSAFSWYILFTKLWSQQRVFKHAKQVDKAFWTSANLREGIDKLDKDNVFRAIAEDGLKAAGHHDGKLTDQIDLNEWISMSLQRSMEQVNSSLQTGLAFLASVGSTAPFVGLFGTVWGILKALIGIGVAGQASIDKVAGPVGEALIMTAIGLAVAVPAVLAYNWLVRRNKVASEALRNFSADIHGFLLSGKMSAAQR